MSEITSEYTGDDANVRHYIYSCSLLYNETKQNKLLSCLSSSTKTGTSKLFHKRLYSCRFFVQNESKRTQFDQPVLRLIMVDPLLTLYGIVGH